MYNVPVHIWVSIATINFKANVELWLQTFEAQHSMQSWPEFCVAVEKKFGAGFIPELHERLAINQADHWCSRVLLLDLSEPNIEF
jgi:hypothetical protein